MKKYNIQGSFQSHFSFPACTRSFEGAWGLTEGNKKVVM
jgi:hypothetical protein